MKTAVIVTTFNRPACLARSLPQIVAAAKEVSAPVLVVDDGSACGLGGSLAVRNMVDDCEGDVEVFRLPENRGLAGALNIGLAYWLADPSIEVIHYFQDDVEVDPLCIAACNEIVHLGHLVTGHDAKEHREKGDRNWGEMWDDDSFHTISARIRPSCRATHMSAHVAAWKRVMPIRSRSLHLPSREIRDANNPKARGTGSGVDWWVVRDSPNRLPVLCIPGLVRSFAHKREDSTWDNESIAGEEPALSRDAIKGWMEGRK